MSADALAAAVRELGNTEQPPESNRTKYGKWYGLDGQPWCMMFVQWCFAQAGTPLPCRTASCSQLLNWYRRFESERVTEAPQQGDVVIYNFGHTGIVERDNGDTITVIEGNTSPGNRGSQNNGGGVYRRTRKKAQATAYIRPFSTVDTGEEDPEMDQETFRRMWLELRKELQDTDSESWSREARDWAVQTGLIRGSGTLPDGSPNYMWEDLLTREQMTVLLYRFAQAAGLLK